jgi:hypothetical protein
MRSRSPSLRTLPSRSVDTQGIIRVLDLTTPKAEPIRMTAGTGKPGHEGHLSWSPDGKSLAFLSDLRWRQDEHIGFEPYFLEFSIARDGTAAAVSYAFDRGPEIFSGALHDRASWIQRTRASF